MDDRRILDEQIAYDRARAGEYDEWWFRQGRYDRGVPPHPCTPPPRGAPPREGEG